MTTLLSLAWFDGLFTATNLWVLNELNNFRGDQSDIHVWIRHWCEQNPTMTLVEPA